MTETLPCAAPGARRGGASGMSIFQHGLTYTPRWCGAGARGHSWRSRGSGLCTGFLWVLGKKKPVWVHPWHGWVSTFCWFMTDGVISKYRIRHSDAKSLIQFCEAGLYTWEGLRLTVVFTYIEQTMRFWLSDLIPCQVSSSLIIF